ncbi:2OG-Fe(II) oxygenase family protein [Acuticoccus sp. MNP-M23]|uniref:isopenicillin N synthase family dioxygenase n=1 Tax=Acuticoccus sp. MNP-M23 TaxID=3072793 RepID=UPI0028150336|nr:2OG-Fe(II) oxygenase family protein [Acuticoccus sp. MNP-M23]WMS42216.1 2OG-Fe(II) oxygenase family protein [Acuticoccus sp. MNP-M23]
MFSIERVDFRDPNAPEQFTRSLRETGFAVLEGHPISPERIEAAYAAWGGFFNSEAKADFRGADGSPEGFFPFRSENAKGAKAKDLKEFFQVYPATKLPEDVADVTRGLYADLVLMGVTMLQWIQDCAPDDVRNALAEPLPQMLEQSEQSMLRILHYPAQDDVVVEEGAERAAAHEDINLITLLVAGSAPGLQAQDTGGNWHDVPCDPGMIAVNTGDMLQLATGGAFPSTTHRVVNPESGGGARFSMPMFVHPRPDVALSPEKTAGAYLAERLREIGLAS